MPELSLPEPQIVMPPSLKGSLRAMPEVSAAVPPKLIESSDIPGYNDNMWGDNEQTAVITQLQNRPLNVAEDVISTPKSTERKYPRKKISKLGAGVLIGLASLAPGKGLIDRVADPFVDGGSEVSTMLGQDDLQTDGDVLHDMFHSEGEFGLLKNDQTYAAFKNMSASELEAHEPDILTVASSNNQDFVAETLNENREFNQDSRHSTEEISKIFSEMDDGNLASIDTQAREIIKDHPDQYMTETEIKSVADAIHKATTPQELIDAFGPTLNSYGKDLDISAVGKDTTYARQYASAIFDVISVLPRELVRDDMKFKRIVIVPESNDTAPAYYQPAYNEDDQKIVFVANRMNNTSSALLRTHSLRSVAAHEMTHSLRDGPSTDDVEGGEVARSAWHTLDYMFGSPDEPSFYGIEDDASKPHEGHEETRADTGGDTFTGGFNNPDDVRQFTSPLNKDRLKLMQYVEKKYPGSTAVLVSRTMDKVATTNKEDVLQYTALFGAVYALLAPSIKAARKRRSQ